MQSSEERGVRNFAVVGVGVGVDLVHASRNAHAHHDALHHGHDRRQHRYGELPRFRLVGADQGA